MPTTRKKAASKDASDLGQSEVKNALADAQEQGFFGTKVDPLPNSEHSLESGPDAPPVHETGVGAGAPSNDDETKEA